VKTRTRVLFCCAAILLTIPLESVLLRALSSPNERAAVRTWVSRLSANELTTAANQVEGYPVAYRREIMRALSAERRAFVWRHHIESYVANHTLDGATTDVLEQIMKLATPAAFSAPTDELRAQLDSLAKQLTSLIGKDDTEFLLLRLGRRDGHFVSVEPFSQKLARSVRNLFVASARQEDCDCAGNFGCEAMNTYCRTTGISCDKDEDWPMCGWWWNSVCDGLCWGGAPGSAGG